MLSRYRLSWLALVPALLAGAPAAHAETEVDLALVLAVDVSFSMDPSEQHLQRQGYVEAFRSRLVADAVARGAVGRIAVSYVEWAGQSDQKVVVPWTVLEDPAGIAAFADELARQPTRRSYWTSISGAIDFSVRHLGMSGVSATRKVLDISGDGPNNQGRPLAQARADALATGLVINGLPLMIREPTSRWDMYDLDAYYRDCVIGGTGSFSIPIREVGQFVEAIRTKIVREIASGPAPGLRVIPAQLAYRGDCTVSEGNLGRWRD